MMKLKTTALILALSMLLCCFAGCGEKPASSAPAEPQATDAPDSDTDNVQPEGPNKYDAAFLAHDASDVVMTINGEDVTWDRFYPWLYNALYQLEANYGVTDWNTAPSFDPEISYGKYALSYAVDNLILEYVVDEKAQELGVTLSQEELQEISDMRSQYIDNFGGIENFVQYLGTMYITPEYFDRQNEIRYLADDLFVEYFGENGNKLPEADALAYLEDHGYLYAKHILFSTTDESDAPLDDEAVAAKRAKAEEVLAQLNSCPASELDAKFDELMAEYSEDPGSSFYTDGYYFTEGQMAAPFEEAAKSLEVGQVSDIVESSFGFHILYHPQPRADHIMTADSYGAAYTVAYAAALELFSNITGEWQDSAAVEFTDIYNTLDINALLAQ